MRVVVSLLIEKDQAQRLVFCLAAKDKHLNCIWIALKTLGMTIVGLLVPSWNYLQTMPGGNPDIRGPNANKYYFRPIYETEWIIMAEEL